MENGILKVLIVAAGGAAGSAARYLVNVSPLAGIGRFPSATFTVNVAGSFLIGFLMVLLGERFGIGENAKLMIFVGFLGAFTTFSTFELELWELVLEGRYALAGVYLVASVVSGFIGLIIGVGLGKRF